MYMGYRGGSDTEIEELQQGSDTELSQGEETVCTTSDEEILEKDDWYIGCISLEHISFPIFYVLNSYTEYTWDGLRGAVGQTFINTYHLQ